MDICSLCQLLIEDRKIEVIRSCRYHHKFHIDCIDSWHYENNTCPICDKDKYDDHLIYNILIDILFIVNYHPIGKLASKILYYELGICQTFDTNINPLEKIKSRFKYSFQDFHNLHFNSDLSKVEVEVNHKYYSQILSGGHKKIIFVYNIGIFLINIILTLLVLGLFLLKYISIFSPFILFISYFISGYKPNFLYIIFLIICLSFWKLLKLSFFNHYLKMIEGR